MFNRREILVGGAAAATALASGCLSSRNGWGFFSEDELGTLTALCDQIIPADDFPSASQAGVLTFIDRQLSGPYRRHRKAYRAGLDEAARLCRSQFNAEPSATTPAQQLEFARLVEKQQHGFFELVRAHTMEGYYGSPRHGGNRDAVSWHMLGLDEPPLRGRAQYDLTAGPKS